MVETTMKMYNDLKTEFYKKHGSDNGYREDSSIDEYGRIYKTVSFEDEASWYELTEKVAEKAIIEKHGIKSRVTVCYYRTEFWSTEMGSIYLYEAA